MKALLSAALFAALVSLSGTAARADDVSSHHGPDLASMADSVNTPACMAGTRRMFLTAAALQVLDSFVTAAANRHAATQRVAPYGQYRSAATPLLELAAQDAIVSLALGATHASCRARSVTWFAFGGAAAYNAFATTGSR